MIMRRLTKPVHVKASLLVGLVACVTLLVSASGCGSDQQAESFDPPSLPDKPPMELMTMAEDEMRQELIDELGLGQVLTASVLAEMDAARDQAALEAFPQLVAMPGGGADASVSNSGAAPQTSSTASPQASVNLTSALFKGGNTRRWSGNRHMQLNPQGAPNNEYNGAMIGVGFLSGMWARSKNSVDLPSGDKSSRTTTDGGVSSTVNGSYGVEGNQMVADVTVTTQKTINGTTYTEAVHVVTRGDACPDADGKLKLELKLDRTLTGGGASASRMWNGTITGHVGDDALLKKVDFEVTTSTGDSAPGAPSAAPRITWSANAEQVGRDGNIRLSTNSVSGSGMENLTRTERMTAVFRAMLLAEPIADLILPRAQDHWRNGGCVVIEVPEGTRKNVKPNEVRPFTAHVKQKWEGVEVPARVTAQFSGKEKVEPMEIDPAPDKFTVTAGNDGYAVVNLETVSRRGRDTEVVQYSVAAAFRVVGGLEGFQVNQVVCDITHTFHLQDSNIDMTFNPDLNDPYRGTYTYTGTVGGAPAEGSGTYEIQVTEAGGTMVGSGTGSIDSPLGTFSAGGTEKYTLTPADC